MKYEARCSTCKALLATERLRTDVDAVARSHRDVMKHPTATYLVDNGCRQRVDVFTLEAQREVPA